MTVEHENHEAYLKSEINKLQQKLEITEEILKDSMKIEAKYRKKLEGVEFQLDKHTGKVGYEYITKILKEILN